MHGEEWDRELVKEGLIHALRESARTVHRQAGAVFIAENGRLIAGDGQPVSGWRLVEITEFVLAEGDLQQKWYAALMEYARLQLERADMDAYFAAKGINSKTFYDHVNRGADAVTYFLKGRADATPKSLGLVSETSDTDRSPRVS